LGLLVRAGRLTGIEMLGTAAALRAPAAGSLVAEVARQLAVYFEDPAFRFDLPLETGGTPYQRRVWDALTRIPPGEPPSYGALAREVGGGARAVGGACRANPIPIVIPCHRVVAVSGLGGYMGAREGTGSRPDSAEPLAVKAWLLAHERRVRGAG
jgi:methylated-DNA-[protein]-cysteine S-methyltransferase